MIKASTTYPDPTTRKVHTMTEDRVYFLLRRLNSTRRMGLAESDFEVWVEDLLAPGYPAAVVEAAFARLGRNGDVRFFDLPRLHAEIEAVRLERLQDAGPAPLTDELRALGLRLPEERDGEAARAAQAGAFAAAFKAWSRAWALAAQSLDRPTPQTTLPVALAIASEAAGRQIAARGEAAPPGEGSAALGGPVLALTAGMEAKRYEVWGA